MWPLSSSWNPSAHLALLFLLRRYPPSDAVLTPAILPITGRIVEGGNVLFLSVQVQGTCPLQTENSIQNHFCRKWTVTSDVDVNQVKSTIAFKHRLFSRSCSLQNLCTVGPLMKDQGYLDERPALV